MSSENNFFSFENDFNKLSSKYDKNKLNISFNRAAFIFFHFCISFIDFFFKSGLFNWKKPS